MINDLKDLEKLLKLCRKQGITEITLGTVAVKFGEVPERRSAGATKDDDDEGDISKDREEFIEGIGKVRIPAGMTAEEFIFMSAPQPDGVQ